VTLALVREPPAPAGYDDWDDPSLVARVSERDADALDEIYRRHGGACYRLARRVTANDTLAEDAVQEAFLGLWRSPERFTSGQGSLGAWLLGLTHHKAVDLVRRETSQQRRQVAEAARCALDDVAAGDPEAAAWTSLRGEQVRAALANLPAPQRELLALAYFGGYTQREIAGITGVPLGTVKTRTMTAMHRLRDVLAPLAEEGGRS